MDKSVDSIGSCSLDVDAVSEFSDTSSSLNLLTPSSAKDFTKDFTTGIYERCKVPIIASNNKSIVTLKSTTQTISQLDPTSGKINTFVCPSIIFEPDAVKKPSYINIACCVNGYSNLTTYDSKLRQDINRSREVSPIRPITQFFYNRAEGYSTHLSIPFLNTPIQKTPQTNFMMDQSSALMKTQIIKDTRNYKSQTTFNGSSNDVTDNGCLTKIKNNTSVTPTLHVNTLNKRDKVNDVNKRKSFIQQRVERLYGKDSALAQGFLRNRKSCENSKNGSPNSDDKNYQKISTCFRDALSYDDTQKNTTYKDCVKKVDLDGNENSDQTDNASLPVLRHLKLNSEFRKQLQLISPKRIPSKFSVENENSLIKTTATDMILTQPLEQQMNIKTSIDNINGGLSNKNKDSISLIEISVADQNQLEKTAENSIVSIKDGHYFLKIMNKEIDRLIAMALKVENDLKILLVTENDELEEVIGYLRAASGKTKLLCAQKMKQFEGLCHNNICRSPDEPFETTSDDLQGFWDMVMLQVDHVDSLFQEIDEIKANGWKKPKPSSPIPPQGAKMTRKPIHSKLTVTDQSQTNKKTSTSILLAQKREAQRKNFVELKRKNRLAANSNQDQPSCVEIFVSNNS